MAPLFYAAEVQFHQKILKKFSPIAEFRLDFLPIIL